MYTQCPDCKVAFRITVDVLQQAQGRVRCGSCGEAFNALDHLSESPPAIPPAAPLSRDPEDERRSRELMETLDQLTGSEDVRIEDTGIEWRVVDEDAALGASDGPEAGFEDEVRYDDNTPLPDDFADGEGDISGSYESLAERAADLEFATPTDAGSSQPDLELSEPDDWMDVLDEVADGIFDAAPAAEAAAGDTPQADASAEAGDAAAAQDEWPEDEWLDDELPDAGVEDPLPEDDLPEDEAAGTLAGVPYDVQPGDAEPPDDAEAVDAADGVAYGSADVDEAEPPAAESAFEDTPGQQDGDAGVDFEYLGAQPASQADAASDGEAEAVEAGDDYRGDTDAAGETGESGLAEAAEADDEGAAAGVEGADSAGDEEEDPFVTMTANMEIDPEILRKMKEGSLTDDLADEDGQPMVETIIMEGDDVRAMLDAESARPGTPGGGPDPESLLDTYISSRAADEERSKRTPTPWLLAGVAVLALALAGQYVHSQRESLATHEAFDSTLGPIYRGLGIAVTPDWDIRGWQFEATSGSAAGNDGLLSISSRISNRSSRALPYPLVHVSLTDRYEEVIGSRLLEPAEYLADTDAGAARVGAGENFTANITIASTSPDATGFKLNVCYPADAGNVRCAIEDFKNQ